MKIIFCHLLNDYSGSPKVLSQVIQELDKQHEVDLFTGGGSEGFLSGLVKTEKNFFYRRSGKKILTLISYIISQVHLFFEIIKYKNENVIVYVNTLLPFGAAIAGRLINAPVIYHVHESSITPRILKFFLRKVVSLTASKIIFVSKSLSTREQFNNIDHKVIYNVLNSTFLNKSLKTEYNTFEGKGKFEILMVCSLKKYKGVDQFIELASRLEKDREINFNLVLNASDSEIKDYFNNYIMPSNVHIYSRQTDLHRFYSTADLVLNMSLIDQWVETFGLTLLEAMAYGVPVIAPPVGGPSEIVDDGKSGFLVSSYDLDTIEKKVLLIKNDPKLCLELSKNARQKSKKFTTEEFNRSITSLISCMK